MPETSTPLPNLRSLAVRLVSELQQAGQRVATAESCTGGLLSAAITGVSGSSTVFDCGVVSYSCGIKQQLLGVPEQVLNTVGAISPETAAAMAEGVRRLADADFGVGITGVAGPNTDEGKPVGTICLALSDGGRVWTRPVEVQGYPLERDVLRQVAAAQAMELVLRRLEDPTLPDGESL